MADQESTIEPVEPLLGADDTMNISEASDELAKSLQLNDTPPEPAAEPKEPAEPEAAAPVSEAVDKAKPTEPEWVPGTWRAEAKEKWAGLDPVIRAEVEKREKDVARFINETQPAISIAKQVGGILQPYKQLFEQYNIPPFDHIKALLEGHTTLIFGRPEQKLAMFKQLAQDAGLNIASLTDPNAQAVDPNRDYVRGLEQKLANLERGVTGVTTTLQQAREAELSQSIAAFAQDEKAHPHFWKLAPKMTELIDKGVVKTLEDAYDLAKMQDEDTRNEFLEAELLNRAGAKAKAERERAAAARKASGANVTSRSGGRVAPASESLDETLRSTLADIRSRTH